MKHHQVCYQKNHNSNKKDMKNGKQMDNKHTRVTLQLKVCSIGGIVINANQLQIEKLAIAVSLACVYSPILLFSFVSVFVGFSMEIDKIFDEASISFAFVYPEKNWSTSNKMSPKVQ